MRKTVLTNLRGWNVSRSSMKSDCFDPVRFTWIGGWGETGVPKTGWDYRPSLLEKIGGIEG